MKVKQILLNAGLVFGLGNNDKIYIWNQYEAAWRLYKWEQR